jgi:hypothetical protein
MRMKCYFIILMLFVLYPVTAFSYNDTKTHKDLSNTSIKVSILDNYLKNYLGMQKGFDEPIKGTEVTKLIQDGAEHEDLEYRAYNHFYNPINGTGLDDYPFPIVWWGWASGNGKLSTCKRYLTVGIPALVWAMDTDCRACCDESNPSEDDDCNQYSWEKAREYYYRALTSSLIPDENNKTRDEYFTEFFEKLGRILHMLQDMSVPAHTRNDMWGHISRKSREYIEQTNITKIKDKYGNNYENYVEEYKKIADFTKYGQSVTPPKFSKQQDYWDLDRYNGNNPTITIEGQIGLAEFANANFLSQRTIFDEPDNTKRHFNYPNLSSIEMVDPEGVPKMRLENGEYYQFKQYRKNKDGQIVDWILSQKYSSKYKNGVGTYFPKGFILNDPVHDSYASILLPKTIAYTAGLIDYFFRGRMGVVPRFSDYDAEKNIFKKVTVAATNDSKWINGQIEPMPNGTIDLVIRYKTEGSNEYSYIKEEYNWGTADNYFSESNRASFEFPLNDNNAMPAKASEVRVFLVYHGTLGEEEDSVAVGSTEVNFKGSMDIEGRLGETDGSNINGITVLAKNTTGDDETMSGGKVEAVISYRYSPGEYFNVISVETETENISRDSTPIHFDLSNNPLPITATDISISLIYNGKVGETDNSVCVSSPDEMKSDLGISVPEEGVYGLTTEKPQDPSRDGFSKISLMALNRSSGVMNGNIQLAVSYRISQGEPVTSSGNYPETSYDVYNQVYNESSGVDSIPAKGSRRLEFTLGENPIPVWATDVYFWLIIKNSGTTHIGFKDVYEPTPIVVSNLGDWTFLNDTPYEVDTFYGLSLALDIVNYDHTGEGYYLRYDPPYEEESVTAWIVRDACFRLSSIYNDPLPVEEEGYSFNYPRIAPGNYKKMYVLGDETFYFAESRFTWHYPMVSIYPDYTNDTGNKLFFSELVCSDDTCSDLIYASPDGIYEYPLTSIKNQTDCPDEATCNYYNMPYPCRIRSVPAATSFRKLDVYHMLSYSHDDHGEYNDYSEIDDELKEQLQ